MLQGGRDLARAVKDGLFCLADVDDVLTQHLEYVFQLAWKQAENHGVAIQFVVFTHPCYL